jgi:hypothetical protein
MYSTSEAFHTHATYHSWVAHCAGSMVLISYTFAKWHESFGGLLVDVDPTSSQMS